MSVDQNKALIRRLYEEALNKGNLAEVDEIIAPNYVRHGLAPGVPPGPESTKQVFTMMRTAFPDLRITIEPMVGEGDQTHALEIRAASDSRLKRIVFRDAEDSGEGKQDSQSQSNGLAETALQLSYYRNGAPSNAGRLIVRGATLDLELESPAEDVPVATFVGARAQVGPAQNAERFGHLDLVGGTPMVVEFPRFDLFV